jgi:hypothetical protein
MTPAQWIELSILSVCAAMAVFITMLGFKTWQGDRFLCDNCKYNNDIDCHKAERPRARECTAYREHMAATTSSSDSA